MTKCRSMRPYDFHVRTIRVFSFHATSHTNQRCATEGIQRPTHCRLEKCSCEYLSWLLVCCGNYAAFSPTNRGPVVSTISRCGSSLERLSPDFRAVSDLSATERDQLFRLLGSHCANVKQACFDRDLDEKQFVLMGRVLAGGAIRGFCTFREVDIAVESETVRVIVTGDTLLALEDWASGRAVRSWWQHMQFLAGRTKAPVYWVSFLESHRVYRLLGGLFESYFPRAGVELPARERHIRDTIAAMKYPGEYDAASAVIKPVQPTPVCAERVAAATAMGHDPASRYFVAANPGYLRGEYLVCIADLSERNWTRLARRMLE